MWSILAVAATSAFSASAGLLSGPAALPLLICLMAMLISSIVGGSTLIGRSYSLPQREKLADKSFGETDCICTEPFGYNTDQFALVS
ncbi:unnamed protein product [Schistosoma curassoni]|uniref:Secreted protein n=1 Tax=Schistosoma curassoni TaxID=6186 RepID=A0A183L234_9TREM|nr:unnamed protein product [Schistosoma curassoni]